MPHIDRKRKRSAGPRVEALETRNLLSVLINAKPTLEVVPSGNRVRANRDGGVTIIQPTPIIVTGTAQPPGPNFSVAVQIFAQDGNGNLVNGGRPLATAVPDLLGRYTATLSLPSRLRRDVNTLVAREVAVGSLVSNVAINPTTLSGIAGNTTVDGTTLRNLAAALNIDPGTLSNLTATINNPGTTTTLDGAITTPATPISGIGGTITTPLFPTSTGTAGPAVSTLLGGTGTLGAQVGTIVGGSASTSASTSTLTGGTGTESARTGTLTNGIGIIDPTTGTLTQAGTAAIAGTSGTSTLNIEEVAVSDPLTVLIHQQPGGSAPVRARSRSEAAKARAKVVAPIVSRASLPRPATLKQGEAKGKGR